MVGVLVCDSRSLELTTATFDKLRDDSFTQAWPGDELVPQNVHIAPFRHCCHAMHYPAPETTTFRHAPEVSEAAVQAMFYDQCNHNLGTSILEQFIHGGVGEGVVSKVLSDTPQSAISEDHILALRAGLVRGLVKVYVEVLNNVMESFWPISIDVSEVEAEPMLAIFPKHFRVEEGDDIARDISLESFSDEP